jgi:hypothetical protein
VFISAVDVDFVFMNVTSSGAYTSIYHLVS